MTFGGRLLTSLYTPRTFKRYFSSVSSALQESGDNTYNLIIHEELWGFQLPIVMDFFKTSLGAVWGLVVASLSEPRLVTAHYLPYGLLKIRVKMDHVALKILTGYSSQMNFEHKLREVDDHRRFNYGPLSAHDCGSQMITHFTHPGIEDDGEHLCLALELLQTDVQTVIRLQPDQEFLPLNIVTRILSHTLKGLETSHRHGIPAYRHFYLPQTNFDDPDINVIHTLLQMNMVIGEPVHPILLQAFPLDSQYYDEKRALKFADASLVRHVPVSEMIQEARSSSPLESADLEGAARLIERCLNYSMSQRPTICINAGDINWLGKEDIIKLQPISPFPINEEPLGLPTEAGYGYFQDKPGNSIGPDGRFIIQAELGFGTASGVWLTKDGINNSYVSLKILKGYASQMNYKHKLRELDVHQCFILPLLTYTTSALE
ncbi:uncharacterized protein BT62DRAFT_1079492 [Guyanagaster necrorhizus]|uniref:non-specific serine/threonine protein kinase n=1 Tax=Guyanagaster necrorhizus TaxID=856835 RepID=A0A9P7VJA6_9AGAR|nr:uncharacterized protein BT62DRAFT_1079492 [Guyanagaster necrorhizus MCA 3950]KAG7442168.1 hypothetical protein BT62DRAFT_1079492 [Guyanagaster necrorhizus MCA 3950]